MSNICIIPARGNSKRIKNKNIRLFNDKPMISFAIEVALASNLFEHIVVSTDNLKIKEISEKCGAEVPFIRPDYLSDDYSNTQSVICHGISECENFGWNFSFVCCIYPCVPLLRKKDIIKGFDLVNSSIDYFVFPISELNSNPQRSLELKKNDQVYSVFPNFEKERNQDLKKTFFDVGQFYWGHKELWKTSKSIHNYAKGMVMPKWRAVDIDTEEDWIMSELMYTILEKRGENESL